MEDISDVHDLVDFKDDLSLCDFQIDNPQEPDTDSGSRSSVSDEEFSFDLPTTTTQFGDHQENPNFLFNYSARSFRDDKNFNRVVSMETTRQVLNSSRNSSGGTVWKKHRGGLIGLTRIPATMDLSELKKRQNQQPPRPMFQVAAEDGGDGGGAGAERGHWSLLGALRHRSIFLSVLTKVSSGCIPRV